MELYGDWNFWACKIKCIYTYMGSSVLMIYNKQTLYWVILFSLLLSIPNAIIYPVVTRRRDDDSYDRGGFGTILVQRYQVGMITVSVLPAIAEALQESDGAEDDWRPPENCGERPGVVVVVRWVRWNFWSRCVRTCRPPSTQRVTVRRLYYPWIFLPGRYDFSRIILPSPGGT